MERREHYDPEDIESLLQERSYDELLEEERAFVLRHLSGREEYETMRALLHHVREDDRRREPVTVGPDLRDDLMTLFRANRQQPQWRIWLNSLGGMLVPGETRASSVWRPALAFGALALLITAGIRFVLNSEDAAVQLAELKPGKEAPIQPAAATAEEPLVNEDTARLFSSTVSRGEPDAQEQGRRSVTQEDLAEASATISKNVEPIPTMRETEALEAAAADDESVAMERVERNDSTSPAPTFDAGESIRHVAVSGSSHTVTAAEMAVHQSVANATGKVLVSGAKDFAGSATALAAAREVIPLFATGW